LQEKGVRSLPQWRESLVRRGALLDRSATRYFHRSSAYPALVRILRVTSRLGNGVVWYVMMLMLPVISGAAGFRVMLHMVLVGAVNLAIYAFLKAKTRRPRPFMACEDIRACGQVLDHYSFPSGHTLHAVAFTILLCAHFPAMAWVLWPFTILIASARVALGLHYPSDVAVGAAIGVTTALLSLVIV
jgi:undecaprenyl-diphosphatase